MTCGVKIGVCGFITLLLVGLGACKPAANSVESGTTAGSEKNSGLAERESRTTGSSSVSSEMKEKTKSDSVVKPAAITKTDAEWKQKLTAEEYRVLREKGTERAFTGKYWDTPGGSGEYRCAACDNLLFKGTDKFVSECGWPAFDKAIKGSIKYESDRTFGMVRTEVMCSCCGGHLGHVFEDGPRETTGIRYCINSVSIKYTADEVKKDVEKEAIAEVE